MPKLNIIGFFFIFLVIFKNVFLIKLNLTRLKEHIRYFNSRHIAPILLWRLYTIIISSDNYKKSI